jgi:hypothetical protein
MRSESGRQFEIGTFKSWILNPAKQNRFILGAAIFNRVLTNTAIFNRGTRQILIFSS